MLNCPKFSLKSKVHVIGTKIIGEIVKIQGIYTEVDGEYFAEDSNVGYKVVYWVKFGDSVQKVAEEHVRDVPEVDSSISSEMDKFLADSLLLTSHSNPEDIRIKNTIKELLDNKEAGGELNASE